MVPSQPSRLLIAYSWSINNIGDIGITPGVLNLLKRQGIEWPVTVLASQPEGDPAVEKVRAYFPRYYPDCSTLANPFVSLLGTHQEARAPGSAWHAFHSRWGRTQLEGFQNGCAPPRVAQGIVEDLLDRFPHEALDQLRRENAAAAEAFERAGFVLYNSGTTFNFGRLRVRDLWGYALLWAMPLIMARALKIPYGVNGQSFEAIEWPWDIAMRRVFADARFVFCRDTDSLEYLQQRGLLCRSSGFRPDSTFFFQGFDEPWADEFLKTHSLASKEFICVITRIPGDAHHYHDPAGGALSIERRDDHTAKLRRLIEEWIARTGLRVLICPENRAEIDRARTHLYDRLSDAARSKCVCMGTFWTTEQAYSMYRRARIVVSMEMHSIIMALNVGTPIIHPVFLEAGRKARMVADIGLADWYLDIDSAPPDALVQSTLAIHRDYPQAEARVKLAMSALERLALEVVTEVKSGWRAR